MTITREKPHCCEPDINKMEIENVVDKLKQVCQDLTPIPSLYVECMIKFKEKEEFVDVIPDFKKIKNRLYNARLKFFNVKLKDVVILQKLADNFLLFQDGSEEKIIVFMSQESRAVVSTIKQVLVDGTFKSIT